MTGTLVSAPTRTSHHTLIAAPPEAVYGLIADVLAWPQHFGPNVHVEQLANTVDGDGNAVERIQVWATANGQVKTWTSRRELAPAERRITFRQEVSAAPVASMGGAWIVTDGPGGGSRLVLEHDFTAVGDDAGAIGWISEAVDRNSTVELSNIKALAEQWQRLDELVFRFDDSVLIDGPADRVYEFLYRSDRWPERLPHVARLELTEDDAGVQTMVMDTSTKDGSTHTTTSIRVCFADRQRIVYKQIQVPALMNAHTGEWTLTRTPDGRVLATSAHTVTLKPAAIEPVLGAGATVATARDYVRRALGTNSTATLTLAKAYAEAGRG